MEKIKIPTTNHFGNGVTQWADGEGAPDTPGSSAAEGRSWWNGLLDNMAGILNGAANIVGAANSYDRTTTTNNNTRTDTTGAFSFTNGTTITAMVLGGVAVVIVLIIVLGRK